MNKFHVRPGKPVSILIFSFLFVIGVLSPFMLPAQKQSKKELENKRKQLQKEIENTDALLKETRTNKKRSITEVMMINKKIAIREELIGAINYEITGINKRIRENNNTIDQLKRELEKLKKEYAEMIRYAFKNRDSYNRMMFVFASRDFEQAFMRLKYLQQYGEFRKKQARLIEQKTGEINEHVGQLEEKKTEKRELLVSEQSEKKQLTNEKQEKEEALAGLQDKEKKLKRDLDKKRKAAKEVQEAIAALIQEEIRKSQEKERKENRPVTNKVFLSPDAQALSGKFSDNKGKLPWPLVKGVITERFGSHPHPLMPDIEIQSNGITISTSKGALARSVFEGEVTGVKEIPGSGLLVIVRHGEYLSVYANLKESFVKIGDKVKTKENIGTLLFDEDENKTELHVEIWKGQNKLDPEQWLYRDGS